MAINVFIACLEELHEHCEQRDGKCLGCIFASDRDNDYECYVKLITGTYPDSWRKLKDEETS